MDFGHWIYDGIWDNTAFGFVYMITNNLTNRSYIGKKKLTCKVTKQPLKGRVNKRRSTKESKWREYTGSSNALNADISTFKHENFTFAILTLHSCAFELNYAEIETIMQNNAVRSNSFYNEFLSGKIGMCPEVSRVK